MGYYVGVDDTNSFQPGDMVVLQVGLLNIGAPGYIIDTNVTYRFINEHGEVVHEEQETIGVSTRLSYIKKFSLSPTLPPGQYRVESTVTYEDTEAVSAQQIEVAGSPVIPLSENITLNVSVAVQILGLLLAVASLVAYNEYKQAEGLSRYIHMVSEDDLVRRGYIRT